MQNLPACENTLQLVRNAQLAAGAGAGGGVWSKPPEKCRCCYCRRSDSRRIAADAGAEQSSLLGGWLIPPKSTKIWSRLNSHLLRSARLTGAGTCKYFRSRWGRLMQEMLHLRPTTSRAVGFYSIQVGWVMWFATRLQLQLPTTIWLESWWFKVTPLTVWCKLIWQPKKVFDQGVNHFFLPHVWL